MSGFDNITVGMIIKIIDRIEKSEEKSPNICNEEALNDLRNALKWMKLKNEMIDFKDLLGKLEE